MTASGVSKSVASSVASSVTRPDVGGSSEFTPLSISGLVWWLDASDETTISDTGGLVDSWADKSGNGYSVTAATTARPTTGATTINGLNVIDFNGTSNTIATAAGTPIVAQPNTSIIVFNSATINGTARWFNSNSGSGRNLHYSNNWNWAIFAGGNVTGAAYALGMNFSMGVFNGASSKLYQNALSVVTGDASTQSLYGLRLGSNNLGTSNWAQGSICEVLVYDSDVSARISDIKTYINGKWGSSF